MKSCPVMAGFALASLLLTVSASADVGEGIRLLRQARASLEQGDADAALTPLDQAYIELPFSAEEDFIYHERADAYAADGRLAEALTEYGKALHRPSAHRARFNSGVLQSRMAEQALEAAGVPLDPAGIPAEADPAPLIEAIEQNMPLLEEARLQFMEALRLAADDGARESVSALTARLDDLAEMLEDLRNREQEDNEDKAGDEEQDDEGDEANEANEANEDEQDKDQKGDEQQPSEDDPDGEEGSDDPQDQEPPEDQPPPEPQEQPQAQPRPELTSAELADLLEQLEELEEMAMELDRQRRAQEQVDVEKDW